MVFLRHSRVDFMMMMMVTMMLPATSAFSSLASRSSSSSSSSTLSSFAIVQKPLPNRISTPLASTTRTTTRTTTTPYTYTTSKTRLCHSVEGDFDPESLKRNVAEAQAGSFRAKLRALYKFTRPHTIRGTILASIAGTVRALLDTPGAISSTTTTTTITQLLPRAFLGMVALLLGNAFIVGINQIYDDDIDKLNKPFLPVASGEMSKLFAWVTVITSGVVGPVLVKTFFPPILFKLYMIGCFLGGIYSVPPIRTKQNPLLAGLTIATVRGFLLNFGIYYAVKDALVNVGSGLLQQQQHQLQHHAFVWSPKVAFIARFMTIFATCIAVTKDLPDVQGDRAFQISTFATQVGVPKIAMGATACLALNYVHAIVTGLISATASTATAGPFNAIPMIGGHALLAIMLMVRYKQLDANSMPSIKAYYKHIWDLFYLEYVLYMLI